MIQKKSRPLDPTTAEKLLDLLGSDDAFRDAFVRDPSAALASIGYQSGSTQGFAATRETSLVAPFSACDVSTLASKEELQAARSELLQSLTQGLAYNVPTFEAETFSRRDLK